MSLNPKNLPSNDGLGAEARHGHEAMKWEAFAPKILQLSDVGFRIYGLGFRVQDLGLRV